MNYRAAALFLVSGLAIVASPPTITRAQESTEPASLELSKPIIRDLAQGQSHKYSFSVTPNQYIRVVAKQNGIDIMLTFLDSAGRKLVDEYDNYGGVTGIETFALITSEAGTCTVEVRAAQKTAMSGHYTIVLTDFRSPSDKDRLDAEADTQFRNGTAAFAKRTAAGYAEAIEKLTFASGQYRQAGDQRGEGQALDLLGQAYNQIGEKHKFRETRERALPIWRELRDRKAEALGLNAIGTFHLMQGNSATAIDYFDQAIIIYQELGERSDAAVSMNNIAVISNSAGEYQKALDYFQQVLGVFRELGGKREETVTLRNIGNVFWVWGDRQTSFEYYRQALEVARAAKDSRSEAQALEFIGTNYYVLGDVAKSLESLELSLELHRQAGNQVGQADTLTSLGLIHYRMGEPQKSLDFFNQALAIWERLNLRVGIAGTTYHLGMTYYDIGDLSKALEAFTKSLELHRATAHKFYEADALRMIATIERDRGQFEAALTHATPAVEMIEAMRQRINLPVLRSSFFSTMQDAFDVYVDTLMELDKQSPGKYAPTALQGIERARARSLIDILIESNANIKAGVDPHSIEQEQTLLKQLSTQATALTRLLSGKYTEEQKAAASQVMESLQRQYEAVEAQIREHSPNYAALTQPKPLTLTEIQRQLLDPDTVLLEYALGRKRSYLFAVTRDSLKTFELPAREQVEQAARRVYQAITARNKHVKFETVDEMRTRVGQADKDYSAAAIALSRMIISPATDQLQAKRLLVVADGALQYISFGALPVPDGREPRVKSQESRTANPDARLKTPESVLPLVAEHEIVSLPSASTLAVLRRGLTNRPPAPKLVVVLADPVFAANDERLRAPKRILGPSAASVRVATRRSGDVPTLSYLTRAAQDIGEDSAGLVLTRLPFTRDEANAIAKMVGVHERRVELDFDANRHTATSPALAKYRIVHFATHGFLDSVHPNLSGLAFSLIDQEGQPQDGFLRASEIFNLKLPADLVVLSGCRTGLGKEIRGEGLIGLTRGFMYAGAARVMVSLWDVQDEATAELMKRFYRALLGKKLSPASALQAAQASMAQDKRWSAPYYWAGFTLQGEPR
ncbi:MAG TPA: CHAT domain-containing tetratricopeptide repeat protein [Pyrinomonadaceae bacterium]|jgi:CHAT domain-containing protein/tetratricopeptide (TPR) repeat protein|nr:CHAT domain-containing tetratricopeptide repeat protein [Pyrinomonadaceae bacterium]